MHTRVLVIPSPDTCESKPFLLALNYILIYPHFFKPVMISPALGRTAHRALRQQCHAKPINCRGLAAAASGTFSYETSEAAGVKIGSRDIPGPTAYLAVVAKAGTRYQPLPGLTEALEKFAFKVGLQQGHEFMLLKLLVYPF